jgi:hypothetical protein
MPLPLLTPSSTLCGGRWTDEKVLYSTIGGEHGAMQSHKSRCSLDLRTTQLAPVRRRPGVAAPRPLTLPAAVERGEASRPPEHSRTYARSLLRHSTPAVYSHSNSRILSHA